MRLAGVMGDGNDDLDAVYALKTPDDNRRHYDGWAGSYDSDFVAGMDYRLPERVAAVFAAEAPAGPVLDVGAGTGLVGVALKALGVGPVDGTDISPGMLAQAAKKGVYARLFEGDLLARLPVEDGSYGSAVSAGTFTSGHVGPEGLDEVIWVVWPGGVIAVSVLARHWEQAGFEAKLADLHDRITAPRLVSVGVYGDGATGAHAGDNCWLVIFRKL